MALMAPIAACATITRGTTEAFVVETEPSGASVTTSTGLTCPATPCTFARVSREAEFTVTVELEGYETTTHIVTHQMSTGGGAGMAGNVILGGLVGAAIDANSGATQELVPNPLRITLRRIEQPTPAAAPETAGLTSMPIEAAAQDEAAAPAAAPTAESNPQ